MRSSNNYNISLFCVLADPRETRRVDTFLTQLFPEKSRSYIQKMIEEGKISCNGEKFTKNKKIYRGDVIQIEWKVEQMELVAENIAIDIIFENDDFAIINKDAGINTHPTPGEEGRKGTLVNALLYHFKNLGVRSDESILKNEFEGEFHRFSPSSPDKGRLGGVYIEYDPNLTEFARENRKNMNTSEKIFWKIIQGEKFGYKFLKQKPIGNYIVDFYCSELQLAIEIDGDSHPDSGKYDIKRTEFLNSAGIHVLRFTNKEILENLDGVHEKMEEIIQKIKFSQKTPPNLPLSGEGKNASIINGVERPGIVHRLDKDTSGLIIIAKNDKAMHALQLKIAKRTISKTYLALVDGIVKDEEGYIESFIGRDPYDRKRMTTIDPVNPKLAKTKFYNRGVFHDKYTLLEVDLLTGRTHQIRVHLASIGFPIIGDKIYGREKSNKEAEEIFGLTRQWLHAYKLEFNLFGKDYHFEAPLKDDLKKMI